MQIALKNSSARAGLAALQGAVFIVLTFWVGKAYFAGIVSHKLTSTDLSLATRLDPGDSDYHLTLGRLYQYSLTDIDPARAISELSLASEKSPMDAQPWLDLGAAQELAGHVDEAEASLRRADYLAPNLPGFQWAIANFFLLHGNVDESLRHFRTVLAGTSQYDGIIFSTAWKAVGNADEILAKVIPGNVRAQISYMYYLAGQKKLDDAQKVWALVAANDDPFTASQVAVYVDGLIFANRPEDAYHDWMDLERRKLVHPPSEPGNLVTNGDFESEIINFGFGWKFFPPPGIYVGLDSTTFHSGGRSLFIRFPGKDNYMFRNVCENVRVTPGESYRARAFMKTEEITTNSGPRLEVLDEHNPRQLDVLSDQLTGTNDAWTLLTANFAAKPDTRVVSLCISRLPSDKLDSLISGRTWVDDVSLVKVEPDTARPRQ